MRLEVWADSVTRGRARSALLLGSAGVLLAAAWVGGGAQLWADHAARGRLRHLLVVVSLVALMQLTLIVLPLGAMGRRIRREELEQAWFVQQVLDSLPVGVAATDLSGRVAVNRVARRRRGLPMSGEVVAGRLKEVTAAQTVTVLDPEPKVLGEQDKPTNRALAGMDTDITALVTTPVTVTTRTWVETGDAVEGASGEVPSGLGETYRLSVQGRPLRDQFGRVIGSVVVDQDLTGLHESNLLIRQSFRDTKVVAEAVRAILRRRDGRSAITAAAKVITSAAVVALFEPDGHGDLVCSEATAPSLAGLRVPLEGASALATCYSTMRPTWIADIHADPRADGQLHASVEGDLGLTLASGAWYPITSNGRCLGVLVIACPEGVPAPRASAPMLDLLATEIALALTHENLLLEMERLSNSDPLTGAANRRAWELALSRELPRALRERRPLSMLLIDIDHFKQFNDTRGHAAGDQVLREAAQAWTSRLRPGDLLCRWGGEEFTVLLPGCDLQGATSVAEDLRTLMPAGTTCSIGIAEWDRHESHHHLAQRADGHLYTAKATGRDRVHAGPG